MTKKIKSITMTYCSLLGLKKTIELTPEQVAEVAKHKDLKARAQAACDDYARKGFWCTVFVDGVEVASANAEVC